MRNSVSVALGTIILGIAAAAKAAEAQNNRIEVCDGRAPFSVVSQAGDKMVVSRGASPIDALRNRCMPKPYDFVAEDSQMLLADISLARAQNDTVANVRKTYLALQKSVNDMTEAAHKAKSDSTLNAPLPARPADAKAFYLTDRMKVLREQLALALRAALTPEQAVRFDANLKVMKEKEAGAG